MHLKACILKNIHGVNVEIYEPVESTIDRIKNTTDSFNTFIYIFLAESKMRLGEWNRLSSVKENKRNILIVPDESEETLRLSVRLRPRFITKISEEYHDLIGVIGRIMEQ